MTPTHHQSSSDRQIEEACVPEEMDPREMGQLMDAADDEGRSDADMEDYFSDPAVLARWEGGAA